MACATAFTCIRETHVDVRRVPVPGNVCGVRVRLCREETVPLADVPMNAEDEETRQEERCSR